MSRILLGAWVAGFGLLLSGVEVHAAHGQTVTHVGNLTGNAAAGKQDYRRYCVGCHGPEGDGNGENAQCPEISPPQCSNAGRRPPEPCRPTKICITPCRVASSLPICRPGWR